MYLCLQVALPYLKAKLDALYSRHRRVIEAPLVQRLVQRPGQSVEQQPQVFVRNFCMRLLLLLYSCGLGELLHDRFT